MQRAEQESREVRSGWGLRAMSLALILGGERDQVGVFQCPLATMGRLADIWQEEGRRPLKGTKVGVLGAGKVSPLECTLKGGTWEGEKGTWDSPVLGHGVRAGRLVPTEPPASRSP